MNAIGIRSINSREVTSRPVSCSRPKYFIYTRHFIVKLKTTPAVTALAALIDIIDSTGRLPVRRRPDDDLFVVRNTTSMARYSENSSTDRKQTIKPLDVPAV